MFSLYSLEFIQTPLELDACAHTHHYMSRFQLDRLPACVLQKDFLCWGVFSFVLFWKKKKKLFTCLVHRVQVVRLVVDGHDEEFKQLELPLLSK